MIEFLLKRIDMKHLIFFISLILFFTGCGPKFESLSYSKANLQKASFSDMEGFDEDNLDLALEVFKKDCQKASKKKLFKEVCQEANASHDSEYFFKTYFTPYKLYNNNETDEGLITGYFEPLLYGSLKQSKKYPYPIYKTPEDLVVVDLKAIYPELKNYRLRGKVKGNKLIPYDSRKEIQNRKDLEVICYVNDKVELFFLHIQGSGKVQLDNGRLINIGYANQNGRKYRSVGKHMIKHGYIGKKIPASTQGMKEWFRQNPSEIDRVLNHNESYIFFEKRNQGATGSLGVELVPKRNLAVDRRYIPLGMPVFINTKNPVTQEPINQLMVAADTGGAIKGEIRADFFWGFSKEAEKYAGRMKEKGVLYILVPNGRL